MSDSNGVTPPEKKKKKKPGQFEFDEKLDFRTKPGFSQVFKLNEWI